MNLKNASQLTRCGSLANKEHLAMINISCGMWRPNPKQSNFVTDESEFYSTSPLNAREASARLRDRSLDSQQASCLVMTHQNGRSRLPTLAPEAPSSASGRP